MSNNRIHLIDGLLTSVRPPIHPDADPTERGASGEEAKLKTSPLFSSQDAVNSQSGVNTAMDREAGSAEIRP